MSWQNILVLAVFVGVCGFIAYVGDILGRKMGKRRLSIFGLRPRHTAIVTTSITGMLIAIFTISIMSIASKEVQQLVLRGAEVLQNLHDTQIDYTIATRKLDDATRKLDDQKRIVKLVRGQAAQAISQRNRLAAEVKKIDSALRSLRMELSASQQALRQSQSKLSQANTNLVAASREIVRRQSKIKTLETAIASMDARRDWIRRDTEPRYKALRERRIIFRPGQEIDRRVIQCAQSKPAIRGDIQKLLAGASKRARSEGARIGDNNRAVEILPYDIGGRFLKESENIDLVTNNISNSSGSVVLLAISVGNAAESESTLIDLIPAYNRLIYSAGDEIAAAMIDGTSSRGAIFSSLVMFLRSEVRGAALSKGLIPTYDEDGQPSVGGIAWDQVFDLVDRIKVTNKTVQVHAVSTRETWSADTLDLKFEVGDSK